MLALPAVLGPNHDGRFPHPLSTQGFLFSVSYHHYAHLNVSIWKPSEMCLDTHLFCNTLATCPQSHCSTQGIIQNFNIMILVISLFLNNYNQIQFSQEKHIFTCKEWDFMCPPFHKLLFPAAKICWRPVF